MRLLIRQERERVVILVPTEPLAVSGAADLLPLYKTLGVGVAYFDGKAFSRGNGSWSSREGQRVLRDKVHQVSHCDELPLQRHGEEEALDVLRGYGWRRHFRAHGYCTGGARQKQSWPHLRA